MLSTLKKILGIRTTSRSKTCALFSGSAYFSNRVPRSFLDGWVAHGGEISSGSTLDVRARYFFATDPSEPWVTKLLAKSVMVIHAGWILHCVDEGFRVPISEYILDDRFIPELTPPIYVPLSEPGGLTDTKPAESGPIPVQMSDTPSTPTSIPRKRNREQAYFDSPSGSLVFSGFDKDGMPLRPRKQRRLRFDPSFSPEGKGAMQGACLDYTRGYQGASKDDEFSEDHGWNEGVGALRGRLTAVWLPDTPDKPPANMVPPATYRHPSVDKQCSNSPAIFTDKQERMPPIRTIDFTKLPPPTRRFRFPGTESTTSEDSNMILPVVKPIDHKVKTPKKISFASHARVCVYTVSPRRPDTKDGTGTGPPQQSLSEGFEDGPDVDGGILTSSERVKDPDDSSAEATRDLAFRTDTRKVNDDPLRLRNRDPSENDVLTLTMEEVHQMRRRLLESAAKNGVADGQLATLFELGKTSRGMAFHHVW